LVTRKTRYRGPTIRVVVQQLSDNVWGNVGNVIRGPQQYVEMLGKSVRTEGSMRWEIKVTTNIDRDVFSPRFESPIE
jgi:hypothetical protein